MAFESLTDRLAGVFKKLRGHGKLTEADIKAAMREVRMALLEADVNYKVAKDFCAKVSERAMGQEVMESLTPAQQVVKIVNEELVALMGGSEAARLFAAAGARVVAIQDHTATLFNSTGIDMTALSAWQLEHKQIAGFPGAETIASEAFWSVEMDILIPAALEGQITRQRAEILTCKLVLEGANGPTYPDADDMLASRGIIVVPDVVCNAGGVTVSYFEWVQDMASFFWSEEEINNRMDKIMTDAMVHVWEKAAEKSCSLRTAAYIVACERILLARKDRGIYPG